MLHFNSSALQAVNKRKPKIDESEGETKFPHKVTDFQTDVICVLLLEGRVG